MEAAKKGFFLVAQPLRPYSPSPFKLSGYIFSDFFELQIKFIFLVARPLPPLPPLSGQATKKWKFFGGFPYSTNDEVYTAFE